MAEQEERKSPHTEAPFEHKDSVTVPTSFSISFRSLHVFSSSQPDPSLLRQLLPHCLDRVCKQFRQPLSLTSTASSSEESTPLHTPLHTRNILHDLSGYIPSNSLTAIMGGSGAGKTTLLNFLAHRLPGCGRPMNVINDITESSSQSETSSNLGFHVSGDIRVNGIAVDTNFFAKHTAYVPQQSVLLSSLTPREHIQFASKLRLPAHKQPHDSLIHSIQDSHIHQLNTDRILTALSLHQCADTRIGDELIGGGLSGGEKRRTNVAVELVTNPPFLCLDEPTTGLDSLTALSVLKSLKQLTNASTAADSLMQSTQSTTSSVTVVASIHQPTFEMFDLFDHLILLSHGHIVYCGPASHAVTYFTALNFPCPSLENPPEFFLDLIQSANKELLHSFVHAYRQYFDQHYSMIHDWKVNQQMSHKDSSSVHLPSILSPACSESKSNSVIASPPPPFSRHESAKWCRSKGLSRLDLESNEIQWMVACKADSKQQVSFHEPSKMVKVPSETHSLGQLRLYLHQCLLHLFYLTHRAHLNSTRLPLLKGAQILQTFVLGFLIGIAFFQLGKDQIAVQNRLGAVYFINICVMFANTLSVVLNFSEERSLFLREQGNRMYAVWTYFAARISIEIVPTFLCSFGLSIICFWMMDASATFIEFLRFLLLITLLAFCGQGLGLVVACGIASRMLALIITPLVIAPFILFTPYAVDEASLPFYFRIVQVASPFWYGFTALMINMFSDLTFHCTTEEYIAIPLSDGGMYQFCSYATGTSVLDQFGIRIYNDAGVQMYWVCCAVLLVQCLFYRLLALVMLYKLSFDVKDVTK